MYLAPTKWASGQVSDSTITTAHKKGDVHYCLLVGYNFWSNHYAELGIARSRLTFENHQPQGSNYFISSEIRLGNPFLLGPKAGFWVAGGAGGLGLSAIYYTDLAEGAWRLRPELGIGLSRFKLAYGYNITLTNRGFEKVNKHTISLNVLISFAKKRSRN
jgi:hypothetical protein